MDFEDYQEKLRALDRTLTELQARLVDKQADALEAVRLEQEIEALQAKRRELLDERATALGGRTANEATPSNPQGFGTVLQQYTLLGEMKLLAKQFVSGVYVRGCPNNNFAWDGVIFVHSGTYQGALFKFRILIPLTYPDITPPRVFFQSSLYHPRVNEVTGELCLRNQYPKWDPTTDRLWHIVKYIHHMFYHIDVENPVNEGAASLYKMSRSSFDLTAQRCVQSSRRVELSRTGNSIVMESWSPQGVKALEAMLHYDDQKRPKRTVPTLLDGDEKAEMAAHAADLLAPPELRRLHDPAQQQPVDLKTYLKHTLGAASRAVDVRLGDHACAGYITLHGEKIERRYMMLDESTRCLRIYTNEREDRLVCEIDPQTVCNCYQPENPEERSQHIFLIITPDQTIKCGAMSADGLQMWLSAIIHASTLPT